jgi:hypothetical protein
MADWLICKNDACLEHAKIVAWTYDETCFLQLHAMFIGIWIRF